MQAWRSVALGCRWCAWGFLGASFGIYYRTVVSPTRYPVPGSSGASARAGQMIVYLSESAASSLAVRKWANA